MERSMMTIGNAPTPPCHGQQWASINTTSGTRSNSTSKISSSVKLDIASSAVDSSIDDHPDDMLSIRLPSITPAFSSSAASAAAVAASHPSVASLPRISGRFGPYGGRFVGESLIHGLSELERCAVALLHDPAFLADLATLRRDYSGRPTPLCHLPNLSRHYGGGVDIFLKREDLNHTSSHCINAALGHALLAKRMGKRRLVAASGSGHHAAAVAAAAARMGMGAVVYVGERDMGRVPEHVKEALGTAEVAAEGVRLVEVRGGCGGLKDATTEAIREMLSDGEAGEAYLVLPSAIGPHPMPWLAREMQKVVGEEARAQFLARSGGHLPAAVLACVGGGANSLGIFHPFLSDTSVRTSSIATTTIDRRLHHCNRPPTPPPLPPSIRRMEKEGGSATRLVNMKRSMWSHFKKESRSIVECMQQKVAIASQLRKGHTSRLGNGSLKRFVAEFLKDYRRPLSEEEEKNSHVSWL